LHLENSLFPKEEEAMDNMLCLAHLLWWGKMLVFICAGLIIVAPFYFVPESILIRLGTKPFLSPNWITLHRVPLSYLAYYVYFCQSAFIGYCLVVFAYSCDILDGRVARALGNLNPDKEKIGEWLDPLADKVTLPVLMIVMAWHGHLSWPILVVMIIIEVGSQALRLNVVKSWVRGAKAKAVGKLKYISQAFCLIACIPYDQHWIVAKATVPNWLLGAAMLGAGLSVVSRLKIHRRFDAAMDRIN
jgi:phosphatidylglycerophosphate synthase